MVIYGTQPDLVVRIGMATGSYEEFTCEDQKGFDWNVPRTYR
jgi:hypothetical protein